MESRTVQEGPIQFQSEMAQLVWRFAKTQTCRVLKPQPPNEGVNPVFADDGRILDIWWLDDAGKKVKPTWKYEVGDQLWVKEPWLLGAMPGRSYRCAMMVADSGCVIAEKPGETVWATEWAPKNAMYMPRWASRMTLRIDAWRIHRLHGITYDDILAEGITPERVSVWCGVDVDTMPTMHAAFRAYWDHLNLARGFAWDNNPWVRSIQFRLINR